MRSELKLIGSVCASLGLSFFVGCSGTTAPEGTQASAKADSSAAHSAAKAVHEHPSHGPHQGDLIELGDEEYHAELLHDERTHKVTIYLLGSDAKGPVRTKSPHVTLNLVLKGRPAQFTLAALPLEGETGGATSRFQLADEKLCHLLCDAPHLEGRLNLAIDGRPFVGTISHQGHSHAHHDHDHAGHTH